MKITIHFLILSFILPGAMALGQTDSHVAIVINQNGPKNQIVASHKVKRIKSKKKVSRHIKHKTAIAAAPLKKKPLLVQQVAQKQVIVSRPLVPVKNITGQRTSLANQDAARANAFAMDDTSAMGIGVDAVSGTPILTEKVQKEKRKEPESYWEFQYKTNNAVNMNALENYGTGLDYTVAAWDRFYVTYYIDHNISLGVIAQYYHTWFQDQDRPQSSSNPGLTQSYASYLGDTGLVLNDKKIVALAGGLDLSGYMAYYAPTSQSSQTAGMFGQTRTGLGLGKSIGKVDLKWNEAIWYDWQQYETNSYLSTSGNTMPNPQDYIFSNIDVTYNFTSKFSFTLESGFINERNYGDSFNGINSTSNDYIEVDPELDYSFSKLFTVCLGIWEVYNTTNQPTVNGQTVSYYVPFAPYNGTAPGSWTASQLYLMGVVTF